MFNVLRKNFMSYTTTASICKYVVDSGVAQTSSKHVRLVGMASAAALLSCDVAASQSASANVRYKMVDSKWAFQYYPVFFLVMTSLLNDTVTSLFFIIAMDMLFQCHGSLTNEMCKIFTSLRPKINFNSNIVCIKIHINTNAGKSNLSCYGAREQYKSKDL